MNSRNAWIITLAAASVMTITMGARQSLGLFVSPLNTATGLGLVTISFAFAVSQFVWGAIQPVAGALADRYGPGGVLVGGVALIAIGLAATPFMTTGAGLVFSLGILWSVGAGAGSFSVLIGAVAQRLPAEARGKAAGIINAGGSFGQFVFAPVTQRLIQLFGWMGALWSLAVITLAALPLIGLVSKGTVPPKPTAHHERLWPTLVNAFQDRSYILLHLGFFTCGFHIAFLVTHLPGEVRLCSLPAAVAASSISIIGLANVAGSLWAGWAGGVYRMKYLLFFNYFSRAVIVGLYLLAPKTQWTFYLFAAALGFTWLATVPPTAGLIGKLFGVRYLATLFGLTTFTHQIGAFFGAWLGGIALVRFGDYNWMWYADMALAVLAAFANLPIREAPLRAVPQPA